MLPSLRRRAVSPALEAGLAPFGALLPPGLGSPHFERPEAESPTGRSRAECWGEMFAVGQATECQASSAQRRRFLTSPWGRQRLGSGLRVEPETIDLKPIGFLNPALRPIAQPANMGCRLLRKCNS